jgi:hypothetical protein
MTKVYNKDGVIDMINDFIKENLGEIVREYEVEIIEVLEHELGYKVGNPLDFKA